MMNDPPTVAAAAAAAAKTRQLNNSRKRYRGLQQGSGVEDGENGFFPLFAFFLICWVVFVFVKKCCFSRRNQPTQAPATNLNINAAAGTAGSSGNGGDLLSSLTPEERKAYVADLLKSEKYEAPPEQSVDDSTSVESQDENDGVNAPTAIDNTGEEGDIELGDVDRYIDEEPPPHQKRKSHCAICLDAYKDGDLVCSSNNPECEHRFHRACMEDWLQKHEECPCCRRSYLHKEIAPAGDD